MLVVTSMRTLDVTSRSSCVHFFWNIRLPLGTCQSKFVRLIIRYLELDCATHSLGRRFVGSPKSPERLWSPRSLLLNGYRDYLQEVKWPRREVDHSPPSSAKVKTEWRYTSTPLYAIVAWTGRTLLTDDSPSNVGIWFVLPAILFFLPIFRVNIAPPPSPLNLCWTMWIEVMCSETNQTLTVKIITMQVTDTVQMATECGVYCVTSHGVLGVQGRYEGRSCRRFPRRGSSEECSSFTEKP